MEGEGNASDPNTTAVLPGVVVASLVAASVIALVGDEINFSVDFGTSLVVVPASLLEALLP